MNLKASRRRGPELEGAILDAAWEVLVEHGYPGFTYEAVAARTGTSRPVLYRRWPQRDAMLRATLTRIWATQPIEVPDTGNLRDDAIGLLHNVDAGRARMITVLTVQLMDYFRDTGTSFSDLRESLRSRDRPSGFALLLDRAVARGELPAKHRSPRLTNLPLDLMRHDMLMTNAGATKESIAEIVDDIWLPLLGLPAAREEAP